MVTETRVRRSRRYASSVDKSSKSAWNRRADSRSRMALRRGVCRAKSGVFWPLENAAGRLWGRVSSSLSESTARWKVGRGGEAGMGGSDALRLFGSGCKGNERDFDLGEGPFGGAAVMGIIIINGAACARSTSTTTPSITGQRDLDADVTIFI